MPQEAAFLPFAGTSHRVLAQQTAECLGVKLGNIQIETFPDGEIGVQVLENVRGRDVFVLQTIAQHPNSYLMELLIVTDALKRASARSINAVIPYFGYARQDRKDKGRVPITAKLVADLLEAAGVSRVLTLDLHAEQVQGFFDIPVDNLFARPLLTEAIQALKLKKPIVVAPDIGSIKLGRAFAESLKVDYAVIDKRRVNAKQVDSHGLMGDVMGKDVILIDDIYSTGATLRTAARVCQQAGAKRIIAAVTHGLMRDQSWRPGLGDETWKGSAIEKLFLTDSVPVLQGKHLEIVSVAPLLARAIESVANATSISSWLH
jgi:ribose-phosphate pyrophosphokinase